MNEINKQLEDLKKKIQLLLIKQENLNSDLIALTNEFEKLNERALSIKPPLTESVNPVGSVTQNPELSSVTQPVSEKQPEKIFTTVPPKLNPLTSTTVSKSKKDWEEFIGSDVLSKVGIVITIIGVFIGVKYAIDHDLISPVTRILLGYLLGAGLVGFAIKLKSRYESFSAVLMGGGIAILYFVTYVAYAFYNLMPQLTAFIVMLICTGGVIWTSLKYNSQIIALLGLLGAYAIPVLLSDGSGRYEILFSYIAIINIGIMTLSFQKNWKLLYHSAFALTWLIFLSWYFLNYSQGKHFTQGLFFLSVFFIIFYITFLAYKLIKKEQYAATEVIVLLSNSFIFYGLGYAMLNNNQSTSNMLGLFTVINAVVHLAVSMAIRKLQLADKALFFLLLGLVFVFITIAIPVQFDGNWVTLLWAGEAALLFRIGRTKSIGWYIRIAFPLFIMSIFSLLQDWDGAYNALNIFGSASRNFTPILNINFISSLLVMIFTSVIVFTANQTKYKSVLYKDSSISLFFSSIVPLVLIAVCYLSLFLEINEWFDVYRLHKGFESESSAIKNLWLMNYSFLFCNLLALLNQKYFKSKQLAFVNITLGTIVLAVFLVQGFILLGELRDSYAIQKYTSPAALYLRYVCFGFAAAWLIALSRYIKWNLFDSQFHKIFAYILHISILSVICNEFIHQVDLLGYKNQYKLGLSIICGVYALLLIILGIWKKKQYLRIGAILLFGLTLVKLFFYDIAQLPAISKTIVLVILGILLLVVAFLYNKYKHIILGEDTKRPG